MVVIDADVALSAFADGPLRTRAQSVLGAASPAAAPDIFFGECANVLAKLVRLQKMTDFDARAAFSVLRALVQVTLPTVPLVERAFELALSLNHGVFDCLYLEVARSQGARLVTADRRFVDKLAGRPESTLVLHLSDWPS